MPLLPLGFLLALAFLAGSFNAVVESTGLAAGVQLAWEDYSGDWESVNSEPTNAYSESGYYSESSYGSTGGVDSGSASYPGAYDVDYGSYGTPNTELITDSGILKTGSRD